MKAKKPNLILDFNLYHDALKTCIHDDDWLHEAFSDKNNILEFAKSFTKEKTYKAVNEYCYSKDIGAIISHKNNKSLSENQLLFFFDQNSEISKINLINSIKNKTTYYGQATVKLLEEYCENTRDLFDATIIPHPAKMNETIRPIKKFGIIIDENKTFISQINDKGLDILSEGNQFDNLKEYFIDRRNSKELTKAYLTKNQLSDLNYNNLLQNLNFYKEVEIPTHVASKVNGDYKIILRKNQIFDLDENLMTISGNNIKILSICRSRN